MSLLKVDHSLQRILLHDYTYVNHLLIYQIATEETISPDTGDSLEICQHTYFSVRGSASHCYCNLISCPNCVLLGQSKCQYKYIGVWMHTCDFYVWNWSPPSFPGQIFKLLKRDKNKAYLQLNESPFIIKFLHLIKRKPICYFKSRGEILL